MNTLTKHRIEKIALKVAALLRDRADGDPFRPETWERAASGLCSLHVDYEGPEWGVTCMLDSPEFGSPTLFVFVQGDAAKRPAFLARLLLHELSHAVLWHYAADVFTDNPFEQIAHAGQAAENVCRAVERYFLADFGRGWLPTHGFYWN